MDSIYSGNFAARGPKTNGGLRDEFRNFLKSLEEKGYRANTLLWEMLVCLPRRSRII